MIGSLKRTASFLKIATNSVTDPAVLLSAGGSILIVEKNPFAAAINITTALLCCTTRAVSEFKKEEIEVRTPEKLDYIFKSSGGSQMVAGSVKLGAAVASLSNLDVSQSETILATAALTGFSAASISRGVSQNVENGSVAKQALDFAGIAFPACIFYFSNPESPDAVRLGYFISAFTACYLSVRNQQPHGCIAQPYLILGSTLFASATSSSDPYVVAANAFWGAGYFAQDALKKCGGVVEAFQKTKATAVTTGEKIIHSTMNLVKNVSAITLGKSDKIPKGTSVSNDHTQTPHP